MLLVKTGVLSLAKEELRGSFNGDREVISGLNASVKINDSIRAGVELNKTRNLFSNSNENYNSTSPASVSAADNIIF